MFVLLQSVNVFLFCSLKDDSSIAAATQSLKTMPRLGLQELGNNFDNTSAFKQLALLVESSLQIMNASVIQVYVTTIYFFKVFLTVTTWQLKPIESDLYLIFEI